MTQFDMSQAPTARRILHLK